MPTRWWISEKYPLAVAIRSSLFYGFFFINRPVADQLLREVDVLASDVNRNCVLGQKKECSVSFYTLLNQAPAILPLPVHLFQVCRRSCARTGSVSDYDALH